MNRAFSLYATIATAALSLTIASAGFYSFVHISAEAHQPPLALALCTEEQSQPTVSGIAAYALDLSTGRTLFEKNADTPLPLASITKLVTAAIFSQSVSLDDHITIPPQALDVEGASDLIAYEKWLARDLVNFTLVTSSNKGARALALSGGDRSLETRDSFIERMNTLADNHHLSSMYFLNETGLDVSTSTAGAYGSAREVALLAGVLVKEHPMIGELSTDFSKQFTSDIGVRRNAEHTSALSASLPRTLLIKTGYTDLAGGNLVAVFEAIPGRPVALVTLGSSRELREQDIAILKEYVTKILRREGLCYSFSRIES